MIVKAAILLNGKIYTGKRHCNIIKKLVDDGFDTPIKGTQGFIDHLGDFYDRKEAAKIVLETGQLKKLNWPPYLYSEDLY